MQDRAQTVIVGAGIVGASAAYHLAELGQADVLVIDRGPLFETGGSTSHAPGLAFQTNGSRTMCRIAQDSVRLYGELDVDGGVQIAGLLVRPEFLVDRDRLQQQPAPLQALGGLARVVRVLAVQGRRLPVMPFGSRLQPTLRREEGDVAPERAKADEHRQENDDQQPHRESSAHEIVYRPARTFSRPRIRRGRGPPS